MPTEGRGAPLIRLQDVGKTYRQGDSTVRAVADVSLTIAAGEFVAIVGPSGSGKSTLLHLIGGLDTLDEGDIVIGDRRLSELSDDELTLLRRRTIGFVFQFFNLLPTLTAEENVALPLLLDGQSLRAVQPKVQEQLAGVGLTHRARHRPDQLSGGEMQRVAIARALVTDPLVLLADEPTGNLDTQTGEEILELIERTVADRGQTIILVTHDPRIASRADRLITLRDGRIESDRRQDRPGVATRPR
jgi:putative ABC transport system ATP-binding protein